MQMKLNQKKNLVLMVDKDAKKEHCTMSRKNNFWLYCVNLIYLVYYIEKDCDKVSITILRIMHKLKRTFPYLCFERCRSNWYHLLTLSSLQLERNSNYFDLQHTQCIVSKPITVSNSLYYDVDLLWMWLTMSCIMYCIIVFISRFLFTENDMVYVCVCVDFITLDSNIVTSFHF